MEYLRLKCGGASTWMSLLGVVLAVVGIDTQYGALEEYCDTDVFKPSCAENEIILMQSAKYGRMRQGKCVEIDLGYLGCYTDVLDLADRRCSGRQTCEIRVPDKDFEGTKPCLKELKTYLEVSYKCIPVHTPDPSTCITEDFVNITEPSGWIASMVSLNSDCGTFGTPWIIHTDEGQRINITLYDFWPERPYSPNHLDYDLDTHVCKEYALIQETTSEWNSVVCGEGKRISNAFISKTNSIQIQITNKDNRYFAIKYQAIGCSDLPSPVYGYFEREESGAVIGCLHSRQKWHIACSGTEWVGFVGNCSAPLAVPREDVQTFDLNLPLGASVAIIIGAALGVGLVVVIIGLLKFKGLFPFQKPRRPYENPPPDTILMREKSPQSDMGQDSGHCSLDHEGITTTAPTDPQQQQQTQGQPRVLRHQRVVKINGSEYAHIWETPIPEDACGSPEIPSCRICPRDPRDPRGVNTVYMLRCKPGDGHCCETMKQFPPFPKQNMHNATYEAPRYSTLDRAKGTYGTTSSSSSV